MSPLVERVLRDDETYTNSMETLEVVAELERRRVLVTEGKGHLLGEDESWDRIRAAGYDV